MLKLPLSNIKKPWLIIALALIVPVIINEIVVALASSMLGIGYHPIPASIHYEIAMLREGYGWALLLAVVLLVTIVAGIIGALFKNIIGIGVLGIPVCFLAGSILGNVLFALMNQESLHFSPFAMFWLYLGVLPTANYNWIFPIYAITIGLSGLFYYGTMVKYYNGNANIHGNSRWANIFDLLIWGLFRARDGSLALGKYAGFRVYAFGFESVLVLAPSGGGKTTSFGIPNILRFDGSTVSCDPSSELYDKTSMYCRVIKESKVYIFAPVKKKTHRWNIFNKAISLSPEYRYGEIQRIVMLIIPESTNDHGKHWTQSARRLLESLAAYLISTTGHCSLGKLAEIACMPKFDKWLEKEVLENENADAQFKVNASSYTSISAAETRSGIKFGMDAFLGLYLDPIIRAATEYSDFNLEDLRSTKMDVFIGIPDGQLKRLAPLITMFFEEASKAMTDKLPDQEAEPYPVFFNIDEFGNLPPIHQIRKNLTIMRKFRVRIAIYFQYKDMAGSYYSDKELKAFLNIKNKLIFTQSDPDDAKYISSLFGMKTKKYKTRSGDRTSEQIIQRPLISDDEIMRLNNKTCLVAIDGKKGFKVAKEFYFKDAKFKKLTKFEVDAETDKYLPEQAPIMPAIPDLSADNDPEVKSLRTVSLDNRKKEKEMMVLQAVQDLDDAEDTQQVVEAANDAAKPTGDKKNGDKDGEEGWT